MARVLCALALAGVLAGSALGATTAPVTVTVHRYPLVCGQATGLLKVVFPAAVRLPALIQPATVTVNERAVSAVSVSKHTVSVIVPRRKGVTCMSVVLGTLKIVFAPGAHVHAGTAKTAAVVRGTRAYAARVTSG
jgi:hypothetical protein